MIEFGCDRSTIRPSPASRIHICWSGKHDNHEVEEKTKALC